MMIPPLRGLLYPGTEILHPTQQVTEYSSVKTIPFSNVPLRGLLYPGTEILHPAQQITGYSSVKTIPFSNVPLRGLLYPSTEILHPAQQITGYSSVKSIPCSNPTPGLVISRHRHFTLNSTSYAFSPHFFPNTGILLISSRFSHHWDPHEKS